MMGVTFSPNLNIFRVFDNFQFLDFWLGQFSEIKYSAHSQWGRIRLNPDISCRAGICGPAFVLCMAWNGQKSEIGPPRLSWYHCYYLAYFLLRANRQPLL